MSLYNRIQENMNLLEQMMINQEHLSNPRQVIDLIDRVSTFWSVLNESERSFVHSARFATTAEKPWQ